MIKLKSVIFRLTFSKAEMLKLKAINDSFMDLMEHQDDKDSVYKDCYKFALKFNEMLDKEINNEWLRRFQEEREIIENLRTKITVISRKPLKSFPEAYEIFHNYFDTTIKPHKRPKAEVTIKILEQTLDKIVAEKQTW